jgi:hypothetical protein
VGQLLHTRCQGRRVLVVGIHTTPEGLRTGTGRGRTSRGPPLLPEILSVFALRGFHSRHT